MGSNYIFQNKRKCSEMSGVCVLCCVTFHLLCGLTKYTVIGTTLCPTSTMDILAVGPGASQALFSQSHQCRSTEVRSQDLSRWAWGPTVVDTEATLALTQPRPMMPTAVRPDLSITGAPAIGPLERPSDSVVTKPTAEV